MKIKKNEEGISVKIWIKPICVLLAVSILFFYSVPAYSEESCLKSHAKGELDANDNHSSTSGGIIGSILFTGIYITIVVSD